MKDAFLKLNYYFVFKRNSIIVAENFIKKSICEGKKPATLAGVAILMVSLKFHTRPNSTFETD